MKPEQRAELLACPFTLSYVGTMLGDLANQERDTAAEEEREPRDEGTAYTLPSATLHECAQDCAEFKLSAGGLLTSAAQHHGYSLEQAGSDFWLTRLGHGAGFWDRGLGVVGDQLTALCGQGTQLGTVEPYFGDNGRVYLA